MSEARCLDSGDLQLTAKLVEVAGSYRLAVDVLGDDDEWATSLGGNFEGGKDVLESRDVLIGEEDGGLLKVDLLRLDFGDEVGGDISSVESHTLNNLDFIVNHPSLLDRDETLFSDLLHSRGDELTDVGVAVSRDRG